MSPTPSAGPVSLLPRPRTSLALVLLLAAIALRIPGMTADLSDHDSWRQTETATIARNFLAEPRILWPRVNWGAPGPGYVEAEFQLYPFATSLLYRLLGDDPLIGRLLSVALTGLTALVLMRLARRTIGPAAGLPAALLFLCAPLVFRYSRAFMPEATMMLFYVVALERYLAHLDDGRWRTVVTAAIAMAIAILVKPTAIHLGLILAIVHATRQGWRALLQPKPLVFALVALFPPTLYYIHAAGIHATYGNTFGVISGGDSKWGRMSDLLSPRFHEGLVAMDVGGTVRSVGLPFALAALLLPINRRLRIYGIVSIATLWTYYCIAGRYAGFAPRGLHYHIYAAVPWALLASAGLTDFAARCGRHATVMLAALTLLVAGYQFQASHWLWTSHSALMVDAGRALAALSNPDDVVVVLSHDRARDDGTPNNFEEPDVLFHAWRRGRVLGLDQQHAGDLRRVLADDARWFVNFPELNNSADPDFLPALRQLADEADAGAGFEVYRIRR